MENTQLNIGKYCASPVLSSPIRSFIWRSLLHLPENHSAYSALLEKGTHPAYVNISTKYPIKSQKLLRVLQR